MNLTAHVIRADQVTNEDRLCFGPREADARRVEFIHDDGKRLGLLCENSSVTKIFNYADLVIVLRPHA